MERILRVEEAKAVEGNRRLLHVRPDTYTIVFFNVLSLSLSLSLSVSLSLIYLRREAAEW